jgi:hypothetical protein
MSFHPSGDRIAVCKLYFKVMDALLVLTSKC